MLRVCLAVCLMLWGGVAPAQGLGLFQMNSLQDGRAWEAVGRLEIAGEAFCTGALIAPNLVLTAAHCLYDGKTGARVPTDQIQFLAGWRNGRASAYRYVRKAVHLPDYAYDAPAGADKVRNDVALLELQHAIRNTTVEPFVTDDKPATGANVGVVSYAHNRSEAPSLQEMCQVLSKQDGVLVMSCAVDFGSSGSPVFSFESGMPRIVSVVSGKATTQGQEVSLGTELQVPLELLRTQLALEGPVRRVSSGGDSLGERAATGARFLRP